MFIQEIPIAFITIRALIPRRTLLTPFHITKRTLEVVQEVSTGSIALLASAPTQADQASFDDTLEAMGREVGIERMWSRNVGASITDFAGSSGLIQEGILSMVAQQTVRGVGAIQAMHNADPAKQRLLQEIVKALVA